MVNVAAPLVLPAGPLASLPRRFVGVWKARDCGIRTKLASPPYARGRGAEMRQQVLPRCASCCVLLCGLVCPLSSALRRGRFAPPARPPDGCVCDCAFGSSWCSWSAPGWSLRCPRLSWRCRFPSPHCPLSVCVCGGVSRGGLCFCLWQKLFVQVRVRKPRGGGSRRVKSLRNSACLGTRLSCRAIPNGGALSV